MFLGGEPLFLGGEPALCDDGETCCGPGPTNPPCTAACLPGTDSDSYEVNLSATNLPAYMRNTYIVTRIFEVDGSCCYNYASGPIPGGFFQFTIRMCLVPIQLSSTPIVHVHRLLPIGAGNPDIYWASSPSHVAPYDCSSQKSLAPLTPGATGAVILRAA